jgi:hypothetical protein
MLFFYSKFLILTANFNNALKMTEDIYNSIQLLETLYTRIIKKIILIIWICTLILIYIYFITLNTKMKNIKSLNIISINIDKIIKKIISNLQMTFINSFKKIITTKNHFDHNNNIWREHKDQFLYQIISDVINYWIDVYIESLHVIFFITDNKLESKNYHVKYSLLPNQPELNENNIFLNFQEDFKNILEKINNDFNKNLKNKLSTNEEFINNIKNQVGFDKNNKIIYIIEYKINTNNTEEDPKLVIYDNYELSINNNNILFPPHIIDNLDTLKKIKKLMVVDNNKCTVKVEENNNKICLNNKEIYLLLQYDDKENLQPYWSEVEKEQNNNDIQNNLIPIEEEERSLIRSKSKNINSDKTNITISNRLTIQQYEIIKNHLKTLNSPNIQIFAIQNLQYPYTVSFLSKESNTTAISIIFFLSSFGGLSMILFSNDYTNALKFIHEYGYFLSSHLSNIYYGIDIAIIPINLFNILRNLFSEVKQTYFEYLFIYTKRQKYISIILITLLFHIIFFYLYWSIKEKTIQFLNTCDDEYFENHKHDINKFCQYDVNNDFKKHCINIINHKTIMLFRLFILEIVLIFLYYLYIKKINKEIYYNKEIYNIPTANQINIFSEHLATISTLPQLANVTKYNISNTSNVAQYNLSQGVLLILKILIIISILSILYVIILLFNENINYDEQNFIDYGIYCKLMYYISIYIIIILIIYYFQIINNFAKLEKLGVTVVYNLPIKESNNNYNPPLVGLNQISQILVNTTFIGYVTKHERSIQVVSGSDLITEEYKINT